MVERGEVVLVDKEVELELENEVARYTLKSLHLLSNTYHVA